MAAPIIKEIKTIEVFDERRYKFTFLDKSVRYIPSVTQKLTEYREKGIERLREDIGTEEANALMNEAGEWGSKVHHAAFVIAVGGCVMYEPPAYKTVGILNEEVAGVMQQNRLIRQQLDLQNIPHMTIHDQFRFLQVKKFDYWMKTVKPEVVYAETVVYSLTHDIAGRLDFLFKVKEGNYPIAGAKDVFLPEGIILPDVKTGAWSNKHYLQMSAYRVAVAESLGIDVVATVGIHLKAATNSGLNTLVRLGPEADEDFKVYQNVAAVYDYKHKNDTPEDYEFETVLMGEQASGVILGATMPNKVAEAQIGAAAVQKLNEGLEFAEPVHTGDAKDFLRTSKKRR